MVIRKEKPKADNKYYIRKKDGGWNPCVAGKPQDPNLTALANCVGYAVGRFNEIGGYGYCKYGGDWQPWYFASRSQSKYGWKLSQDPTQGAWMIWNGHICVVEEVKDKDTVMTSESAYEGTCFYTKTRKRGADGQWGYKKFIGFIPNPAVKEEAPTFNVGDKVKVVKGAKNYTGTSLASWVYSTVFTVKEVKGDRVVIGIPQGGKVVTTAAMNGKDLINNG